jgi:hypothetical protein
MLVFDKNLICNNLEIDGLSQHSLHYFPPGATLSLPHPLFILCRPERRKLE